MINQVNLVGNLGQDPEVRFSTNGNAVTTISIAYSSSMKTKEGAYKEGWIKVVIFKELAEAVGTNLRKGDRVMVSGLLDPNEWTNNEGQKIKQIQIIANMVSKVIKTKPATQNNSFNQPPAQNKSYVKPTTQSTTPFESQNNNFDIPDLPF